MLWTEHTVGIVGGGQLARMLIEAGSPLGLSFVVLDPDPDCPAHRVCERFIQSDYDNADGLRRLAESSDVLTFDLENVGTGPVRACEEQGHAVFPRTKTLEVVQDKGSQHRFFLEHGIPIPDGVVTDDVPDAAAFEAFGYPLVQKARRGGYDGRGVSVIDDPSEFDRRLDAPSLLQRKVDLRRELAVVVARGRDGESVSYAPTECVFCSETNILDHLVSPADVPAEVAEEAVRLAVRTADAFDAIGVFAVELFEGQDGGLFVNEVAPRPHNSGHQTIAAWTHSQFELHLRAILGLPLVQPGLTRPSVMVNLLGAAGSNGPARWYGLECVLAETSAHLHVYGKRVCRAGRKMGHLTVMADSVDDARSRAIALRNEIRVGSEQVDSKQGGAT